MRRLLLLATLLVTFTSFSTIFAQDEEADSSSPTLRVLNLATDVDDLDTRTPSVWIAQDVAYLELSEAFEIAPGDYRIIMNDIERGEITTERGNQYVLVLRGSREEDTLAMEVVTQEVYDLLPSIADITVVNGLDDETSIDLYGSRLDWVTNLPATAEDAANFMARSISAGFHSLIVTEAGSRSNVLVTVDQIEFEGEGRYVIVLAGTQEEAQIIISTGDRIIFNSATPEDEIVADAADAEAASDEPNFDGPAANLRILHFSDAVPMIDAYLEDTRIISGIRNQELSEFVQIPAGDANIIIAPSNTGVNTILFEVFELNLRADTYTTIALLGEFTSFITSTVFQEPSLGSIYDLSAAVTFVHAMREGPQLDIYGNNVKLAEGLSYPSEELDGAITITVTAGTFELVTTELFDDDPIFRALDIPLEGDTPYLIVFSGRVDQPLMTVYGPDGLVIERSIEDLPEGLATETP